MRLIDADELKKCFSLTLHGREVYSAEEILITIQTAPTIDAEPVRHGKWIRHGEPPVYVIECSACGQQYFNHASQSFGNYCSICGAKMDKED